MLNMSGAESLSEKRIDSIFFLWAYIFLKSSFKANKLASCHYISPLWLTSPLQKLNQWYSDIWVSGAPLHTLKNSRGPSAAMVYVGYLSIFTVLKIKTKKFKTLSCLK